MRTAMTRLGLLAVVVVLGGCAAVERRQAQDTEAVLAAAGFQMRPADTPEKLAHLQTLTPRRIVPHAKDGQMFFVYADPTGCQCVWVGDQAAYQRYQQLALQKQLAQEQMMAAQMNEDAAMNWGLWGPFWW